MTISLSYGVVNFGNIIHVREWGRQAVLSADRTTLKSVRWVFDFDTYWNPTSLSYGTRSGSPVQQLGNLAGLTDVALRQYLFEPRRALVYASGGVAVLKVPAAGYQTDALNGPVVEDCSVIQFHGERTFAVSMRIVVHVNESRAEKATGLNVLLSNRWRRFSDVNEDHYAEVITEGLAEFRTDELLRRGTIPDQYRPQLFHPLPPNFRRVSVRTVPTEDGSGVWYRCVDKEEAFNIGLPTGFGALTNNLATRVEAYHQRQVQDAAFAHVAFSVASASAGVILRDRRRPEAGHLGTPSTPAILTADLAGRVGALLPVYTMTASARAWGNRNCRRDALAALVLGICFFRVENFPTGASTVATLGYDVAGKFVECEIHNTYKNPGARVPRGNIGGGTNFAQFNPSSLDILRNMPANGPFGDDSGGFLVQADGVACRPLPNSSGTRGTWIGTLMAQGLSSSSALPPQPQNVPNLQNNVDQTL